MMLMKANIVTAFWWFKGFNPTLPRQRNFQD